MSGRLIITGKKAYCPWAPNNVERVLRDERLERERIEREDLARRQREAEHRVKTWKQNSVTSEESEKEKPKHVNLFEQEELKWLQSITESNIEKKVGIMPVFLAEQNNSMQDFYLRKSDVDKEKDDRIKERNDPMRLFRPQEDREVSLIDKNTDRDKDQGLKRDLLHISDRYDGVEARDQMRHHKKKNRKDSRKEEKKRRQESTKRESLENMKRRMIERDQVEKERERNLYYFKGR